MNSFWQSNASGVTYYPTLITTSNSNPYYYAQSSPLVGVLESPSAPLSDREWLDAQIGEVCQLAESA